MRGTEAQDRATEIAPDAVRRRRLWWAAAAGLLALLLLGAWWMRGWATTDASVSRERLRIATVTRGDFVADLSAQATVVAAVSPQLYAPAPGTVTLAVKAGDPVRKGALLATVDSPALRNEYARERSTLDSLGLDLKRLELDVRRRVLQGRQASDLAGVAIKAAEREFARAEAAWREQVISDKDFQRARDELEAARLTHAHALQSGSLEQEGLEFEVQTRRLQRERQQLLVAELERRVGELELRSPVDGMVGNVAVNQKAAVQQDATILTVVDLSAFEVEFRVAESQAATLGLGMPAEIQYAGRAHAGEVAAISPEVSNGEVTGRVRFRDAAPPGLRQNQRVPVRIVMDERAGVLKLERGGFYEAGGGRLAWIVRGDVAERVPIRTGAASVREVEVLEGLAEGAQVIVSDTSDFGDASRLLLVD